MTSLSLGPRCRGRLGTILHFAHCVPATYPSAKTDAVVILSDLISRRHETPLETCRMTEI